MDLAHARVAGRWAREAGRGIDSCPTYAIGEQGRAPRDSWRAGWTETNEKIKRERRK